MRLAKTLLIVVVGAFIVVGAVSAQVASKVVVEYFRFDLSDWQCDECPTGEFYRVENLVWLIVGDYGDQISVTKVDVRGNEEAEARLQQYDLTIADLPAIVIDSGEHILKESEITEESLRAAIDESLGKDSHVSFSEVAAAFSMGVFSGFSPCLMAMLAFILTYTACASDSLKRGTVRSLIFGIGLLVATIPLGSLILSLNPTSFTLALGYLETAAWIVAGIMIPIGLNLVGFFKLSSSVRPFIQRLANKFAFNVIGLFILGIMFSFGKLLFAFPSFFENLLLLIIYSLGILLPFLAVGLVGVGTPKLARAMRERYLLAIRAFSGMILIAYGIWVMYMLTATPIRIFS